MFFSTTFHCQNESNPKHSRLGTQQDRNLIFHLIASSLSCVYGRDWTLFSVCFLWQAVGYYYPWVFTLNLHRGDYKHRESRDETCSEWCAWTRASQGLDHRWLWMSVLNLSSLHGSNLHAEWLQVSLEKDSEVCLTFLRLFVLLPFT